MHDTGKVIYSEIFIKHHCVLRPCSRHSEGYENEKGSTVPVLKYLEIWQKYCSKR